MGLPPLRGLSLYYDAPTAAAPKVPVKHSSIPLTDQATAKRLGLTDQDLQAINYVERKIQERQWNEVLVVSPEQIHIHLNSWSLQCACQYLLWEKKIHAFASGEGEHATSRYIKVTPDDRIGADVILYDGWYTCERPCPQGIENYKQKKS